jgi:hypothetical protein
MARIHYCSPFYTHLSFMLQREWYGEMKRIGSQIRKASTV